MHSYCFCCGSREHKSPACPQNNRPTQHSGRNLSFRDKRRERKLVMKAA